MKKSLIALTVLSVLSTSAMANECNTIIEGSLFECVDENGQWAYLDKLGQNISFGDENDIVVDVYKNEDGTVTVQRQDESGDWNEVTLSEEEARASIKVIVKERGIEAPIGVPNHGLNLKKGLDPRDKKGYNKLNERAQNSDRVQEFHDIMESSGEYKGATGAERTAALESLLTDLHNDLSNMSKADQAKALAALNNITVSQKYDSVLDQVVNSWGLGTQEQKESFNEWNALSSEEKKILLAERVGYVKPIDAIIDPIIDEPQNGTEFKQKVDGLVGEGTVDKYVEAEDKTIAAADILATEGSEALMDIMIPNPSAGTSGEAKQISLYDYLDSVAKSDPDTFEPRMDSGEIVLRNAGLNLKEAGDNLVAQSKAAKVEVEKAIIATNEDIQRVETTLYKTHDAMELMNKKVEANTAATQTAVNDVKQVQNELDYTQEQLVLKAVSAKEVLQDVALNADEQLSTHLQAKQEVARIELTKSKVKLTKELESLQTQIDNLGNEVDVPGNGIDEGLIAGLEKAKVEVQAEIDDVNALVAENENSVADGKDSLELAVASMNSELQAAKQTMSKELVTAKSTLVTGADALMAQLQAMQARMDSQDALIAELQAGNNPTIPVEGNGIDQDLRDGLQTAGVTMKAQLGKAAETLKTASNGLKNNKPDAGVSPIAPTEPSNPEFNPRDHEFGSVGQGAAKEWKTARIDAGKAQMKDYLDTEFKSFEDDLMARYSSDMADFQNDVQEQMDSVMASSHAISNSRPFLTNGGTAVGVGTGFSGDASAVAIGVAHSFVDTGWSVSGSVNATTGSDSDVSFGAGVQYQF